MSPVLRGPNGYGKKIDYFTVDSRYCCEPGGGRERGGRAFVSRPIDLIDGDDGNAGNGECYGIPFPPLFRHPSGEETGSRRVDGYRLELHVFPVGFFSLFSLFYLFQEARTCIHMHAASVFRPRIEKEPQHEVPASICFEKGGGKRGCRAIKARRSRVRGIQNSQLMQAGGAHQSARGESSPRNERLMAGV